VDKILPQPLHLSPAPQVLSSTPREISAEGFFNPAAYQVTPDFIQHPAVGSNFKTVRRIKLILPNNIKIAPCIKKYTRHDLFYLVRSRTWLTSGLIDYSQESINPSG